MTGKGVRTTFASQPAAAGSGVSAAAPVRRRSRRDTVILNQPPEFEHLNLRSCLVELPGCDYRVSPDLPAHVIHRTFKESPNLPGVIVATERDLCGMLSRTSFFELMGRPFGTDLYMHRPVGEMVSALKPQVLVLPHDYLIRRAARQALARPQRQLYEPVVETRPDGTYRLICIHTLLQAQSHLLSLSNRAVEGQLEEAAEYVASLLPDPLQAAAVEVDYRYIPSAEVGGDAFGYAWLDNQRLGLYLLDVAGHGIGPAILSVSALQVIRNQSLPGVDFSCPAQVLAGLNRTFPMKRNANRFFTIWYGVYDCRTRRLTYGSGGHPPAFLVPRDRTGCLALRTPALPVGIYADAAYTEAEVRIAPDSRLYLFSDGVYEIVTPADQLLTLKDFQPLVFAPLDPLRGEPQRLEAAMRALNQREDFEDDFSLVVFTFR